MRSASEIVEEDDGITIVSHDERGKCTEHYITETTCTVVQECADRAGEKQHPHVNKTKAKVNNTTASI